MSNELLPWQHLALSIRKAAYLAMFSARGGGKTHLMSTAAISLCAEIPKARPLCLRETFISTAEWGDRLYEMALVAFPGTTRNRSMGEIYCGNGSVITLAHVSDDDAIRKILGRNFHVLYADEVGNYPPQAFTYLQRARSAIRPPPPYKEEVMMAGNFGGKSHNRIVREYWSKGGAFEFWENNFGETWVNVPSSFLENKHVNAEQYTRALRVACAGNPALLEAWLHGRPAAGSGALYANYDPTIHLVAPPTAAPPGRYIAGVDWGSHSPAAATLICELSMWWPFGDKHLAPGDIVAIDSVDTVADPLREDLSIGTGLPPIQFGAEIEKMAKRWNIHRLDCVVDDARGLENDFVTDLLNKNEGLNAFRVSKKTRSAGFNLIRQGFQRAIDRERRGLYIVNTLDALARTIPEIPRHPTRLEESDDKYLEDHHGDSHRYAVEYFWDAPPPVGKTVGYY